MSAEKEVSISNKRAVLSSHYDKDFKEHCICCTVSCLQQKARGLIHEAMDLRAWIIPTEQTSALNTEREPKYRMLTHAGSLHLAEGLGGSKSYLQH